MSSEHMSALTAERLPRRRPTTWLLQKLVPTPQAGSLVIETPSGDRIKLRGADDGPDAAVSLLRWRAVWRLLAGGDVGFADAYIDGDWATPDLPCLIDWAVRNEESFARTMRGTVLSRLALRLLHSRRANSRRGSRRNIAAHYDLGNAFYEAWLDRGMSYSSAVFTTPKQSLEQAQETKLDRVEALLDVKGGESVLEIGFGWGGVLERLIGRHACAMTGLTLSTEQLAYAQNRLRDRGLAARADLRLQDYRDVRGQFDRIVSIEMFEAVGERYWPVYFKTLRDRLKAGGTCVLQVITIAEQRFSAYRDNPDFIQRHIFPGGMLPTKTIMREQAEQAGLAVTAEEAFGQSYAVTLQEWRRRFLAAWPRIESMGFDARFRRMWEYYLAYCESGFRCGTVDVSLIQLRGADARA